MNKISLLYFFSFLIFIIGSSSNQNIDNNLTSESTNYDKIFDYLIFVVSGMSSGKDGKCVEGFIFYREEIIKNIIKIVDELEKENFIFMNIISYAFDILSTIRNDCDVNGLFSLLLQLPNTDTNFIKTLWLNTLKTSGCIEDNVNDIMEKPSLEEKLTSVGKVLSSILNIYIEKKE